MKDCVYTSPTLNVTRVWCSVVCRRGRSGVCSAATKGRVLTPPILNVTLVWRSVLRRRGRSCVCAVAINGRPVFTPPTLNVNLVWRPAVWRRPRSSFGRAVALSTTNGFWSQVRLAFSTRCSILALSLAATSSTDKRVRVLPTPWDDSLVMWLARVGGDGSKSKKSSSSELQVGDT